MEGPGPNFELTSLRSFAFRLFEFPNDNGKSARTLNDQL